MATKSPEFVDASEQDEEFTSALAVSEETISNKIDSLKSGSGVYTSMSLDTFADKITAMKAISNATRLRDLPAGTVVDLRNFVVQPVQIVDLKSGEVTAAPRVILVDSDGSGYASVSTGILSSLQLIIGIAGQPSDWDDAIPVVVVEEETRSGYRVNTLKFA